MRSNRYLCVVIGLGCLAVTGCGLESTPIGSGVTADRPLELKLQVDRAKLAPGESLVVTSTVTNPNDVAVNIYLGRSYSGVCFANGSTLLARPAAVEWGTDDRKADWRTGFCGTSSYRLVVAVPAGESVQYTSTARLNVKDKGPYLNFGGSPEYDHLILPLGKEGKFVLRAVHTVVPELYRSYDDESRWAPKTPNVAQGYAPNRYAANWVGTLTSNDVPIEITTDRRGG